MKQKKKINFTTKMLTALFCALIVSLICIVIRERIGVESDIWQAINAIFFQDITQAEGAQAIGLFYLVGRLFLNTVQLVLVPVVFTSIVLAISHIQDTKTLERISVKTLRSFLGLTLTALLLAAIVGYSAYLLGAFQLDVPLQIITQETTAGTNPLRLILTIVPNNLFLALGDNNAILALVFIAIAVGLCINALGEQITVIKKLVHEINAIALTFLRFVITKIGPYAIFSLLVTTFASYGLEYLQPAAIYVALIVPTLLFFLFLIIPAYVRLHTKLNARTFLNKTLQVALFAFSTSSSAASLPLNTQVCNEQLGIDEDVSAFVVPLGAALNKTGTAITQVIATLFVAGVAGYNVSLVTLLVIVLLVLVTSVSTPAIPGAGAIVLFTILSGLGFTNEPALLVYSLILAINPPIEMIGTALNVVGDTASALAVAKSEARLDEACYNEIQEAQKKTDDTRKVH